MPSRRSMLFLALLCCACLSGVSQIYKTQQAYPIQMHGADEQGIAVPALTSQTGQDPSAIEELVAYRAAVGVPWSDLKGQGTISYGSAATSVDGTASIELKGGNESRLDTTLNNTSLSLRIHGMEGGFQAANKPVQGMDPADATVGLFPFAHLGVPTFPALSGVLKDQGTAKVNGQVLRLITYQAPLPQGGSGAAGQYGSWLLNLYFDPTSNLLVKSSTVMVGIGTPRPVLEVMTYGDYREVNGSQIPYSYSESVSGQHLWTIQLTSAQTSAGLSDSEFTFGETTR